MTTFDLAEVRGFAAGLNAGMDRCDNGEGIECATLDAALLHYAKLCCTFCDAIRQWGRAVFAGRVPFDPEVERAWQEEGVRLLSRTKELWIHSQKAEVECYSLDGGVLIQAALWDLERLLKGWVTPKLAVGPLARQSPILDATALVEARQRVASLPPLPANWQPDDPRLQALYRKLRTR